MKKLLYTIDKWGPPLASVISLSIIIVFGWWYSNRIARLEGQVASREQNETNLRIEIQTLQAYVINLKETMIKAGIKEVPSYYPPSNAGGKNSPNNPSNNLSNNPSNNLHKTSIPPRKE